jgi:hypothetical protein
MGPAFYIIAILGCADGGDTCQQVRVAPISYASADACALAVPAVLAGSTDVDAPEIKAECRASAAPQMTQAAKLKTAG